MSTDTTPSRDSALAGSRTKVYLLCRDCYEKVERPDAEDGMTCPACGCNDETVRVEAWVQPVTEPSAIGQPDDFPDAVVLVGHIVSHDAIPMALDFLASGAGQHLDMEELGMTGRNHDVARRAETGDGWVWAPGVEVLVKLLWAAQEEADEADQEEGLAWRLLTRDQAEDGFAPVTLVNWR